MLSALATLLALPALAAADERALQRGDSGPAVEALTQRLAGLGYLPADGGRSTFDDATYHAVVALQKWEGLGRDGIVGPQTAAALRSAERPRPLGHGRQGRRIEVLFDRQVALLIRDGRVKRTIAVSTGAPGYRTPAGRFKVFRKEIRSWSVPFQVWLPYASYFHGGVAFHGYDPVPTYPASHGCVRVPRPFMRGVYRFAKMNTPVLVIDPQLEVLEAPSERPVRP